jgi:hypothetical protein
LAICLAAAALAVAAAIHWVPRFAARRDQQKSLSSAVSAPVHEGHEIRILCGSSAAQVVDILGDPWGGDRYYSGGKALAVPSRAIARAPDPTLFRHKREGSFSYSIPLNPASYEIRLYFAETDSAHENVRRFRIRFNNEPVLPDFDVITDAGAPNTADIKAFSGVSPNADGILKIDFAPLSDTSPFVNAIEILPSPDGLPRPWRMVARQSPYIDLAGRRWDPDYLADGGQIVFHKGPVAGASDPGLHEGERYGSFNYVIPVACKCCGVKLYFAETYFGTPSAPGGAGERLFDVISNERVLLKDFDIYKEAGGANRAVEKSFTGLEPDPLGKIVLRFVPARNYASINAIEIKACDTNSAGPKGPTGSR